MTRSTLKRASPRTDGDQFSRWRALAAACVIALVGLAAYHNSFGGPFIFDDTGSIVENHNIRRLWPIWHTVQAEPGKTITGRPVLALSFALNYQISALNVYGYHAANLTIHILAALTLFGVVRRTLLTTRLGQRFGGVSGRLALLCALIWLVHPLQTESITYVIQRAESLMGLFYLLTVYCAIRALDSRRSVLWQVGAVISCVMGMGTKEVMVTAPLIVLLYDRVFVLRSFKEAFRRRWRLYLGLALTWVVLGALASTNPRGGSAGFDVEPVTPLRYAMTQCPVIIHYLRLSFWPDPLVLDYAWPQAMTFGPMVPWAAALAVLLAGSLLALRYRPALGFAGVWFFVILGPTSSFVPLFDMAFEHRMYLPLAAVVTASVAMGYALMERLYVKYSQPRAMRLAGYALAGTMVVALVLGTVRRNYDYRSATAIWQTVIDERPDNARAYHNRGRAFQDMAELDKAMRDFSRAISLNAKYAKSYDGRGVVYSMKGDHDSAIRDCSIAIQIDPHYPKAYNNRGIALTKKGMPNRAIADFTKAIELNPKYDKAYNNRAIAYGNKGQYDLAIRDCTKAIELNPRYDKAYNNRGVSYSEKGQYDLAINDLNKALNLNPEYGSAYSARGLTYAKMGRYAQAIGDFNRALELNPNDAAARNNRSLAAARMPKGSGKPRK